MVILLTSILIFIDQITKYIAVKYLKGNRPFVIIKDFFQFAYVENRGAAFGILEHKRSFFIIITLIIIIFLSFYLIKHINTMNNLSILSFTMLIGGSIGNLIDRVRLGYVVDFISFKLFNVYKFPVFNMADIFIVCSTILIVFLVMFDKLEI